MGPEPTILSVSEVACPTMKAWWSVDLHHVLRIDVFSLQPGRPMRWIKGDWRADHADSPASCRGPVVVEVGQRASAMLSPRTDHPQSAGQVASACNRHHGIGRRSNHTAPHRSPPLPHGQQRHPTQAKHPA